MQQKCIGVFKVFFFYVTESLKIKKISWERGVKLKMIIDVLFTYWETSEWNKKCNSGIQNLSSNVCGL